MKTSGLVIPLVAFAAGGIIGWGVCQWQTSRSRFGDASVAVEIKSSTRSTSSMEISSPADPSVVDEPAAAKSMEDSTVAEQGQQPNVLLESVHDEETGLPMQKAREAYVRERPEVVSAQSARVARRLAEIRQQDEDRLSFFNAIDTSYFTPEQRVQHADYLAALARRNELMAKMAELRLSHGRLSKSEIRDLEDARGHLNSHAETERAALFEAVARSAGFEGDAVDDFTQLITTIVDTTSRKD